MNEWMRSFKKKKKMFLRPHFIFVAPHDLFTLFSNMQSTSPTAFRVWSAHKLPNVFDTHKTRYSRQCPTACVHPHRTARSHHHQLHCVRLHFVVRKTQFTSRNNQTSNHRRHCVCRSRRDLFSSESHVSRMQNVSTVSGHTSNVDSRRPNRFVANAISSVSLD